MAVTVELALKSCGLGLYHRIVGGSGMATIDQHFALPPFCESLGQHGHTQIISQNTPRIFAYSFTLVVYIYLLCLIIFYGTVVVISYDRRQSLENMNDLIT